MPRGGARPRTGPKAKYEGGSSVMRVPNVLLGEIKGFIEQGGASVKIPLYSCKVSAGFPSPADDYIECKLDLNEHLVSSPSSTFFARAYGNSMIDAGINDGDLLIVDRSITPANNMVVIAAINGELTVKRFKKNGDKTYLQAANKLYKDIELKEGQELYIWGVVKHSIKSFELGRR